MAFIHIKPDNVRPGGHQESHPAVGQPEDAFDRILFELLKGSRLCSLVNQQLYFFFRYGWFGGRFDVENAGASDLWNRSAKAPADASVVKGV